MTRHNALAQASRAQASRALASRHAFVRLADGWGRHLRAPLTAEHEALVDGWCAEGRPFVVARGQPGDGAEDLRLGLALPDKTRTCLRVESAGVKDVRQPPCLAETAATVPASWAGTVASVRAVAGRHHVAVAVYGSLAWQVLTGLPYLRPESDMDLLLMSDRWSDLSRVATALAALDGVPRLDGEAILPDGAAVAWREIASEPARLLVKDRSSVYLASHADVRSRFAQAAA